MGVVYIRGRLKALGDMEGSRKFSKRKEVSAKTCRIKADLMITLEWQIIVSGSESSGELPRQRVPCTEK